MQNTSRCHQYKLHAPTDTLSNQTVSAHSFAFIAVGSGWGLGFDFGLGLFEIYCLPVQMESY